MATRSRAVSHGTTVATNQLLEGKVDRLGFVTTAGYEAMLEIARQSVPDGYGNSYFWVKPDRIVPRDLVRGVEGRLDFTGAEVRPFDEAGAREVARWFRDRGVDTLGVCFLHAYAKPAHEERMREILREEHPDAVVSVSSEVLREYREYERAMTTLVDAAVKPRLSAYVTNIAQRLTRRYGDRRDPVLRHEVQRRGAQRRRGRAPADHHRAVRPGRGRARRGADRPGGRLRPGADQRRRRYVDRRLRGRRRRADADHGGQRRGLPVEDPDDRRRHRRRRRRLDRLALARGDAQGRSAVGGRRPRAALLRPGRRAGRRAVTITDAHLVLGRIPPHLLGGEIPLDADAARVGVEPLAEQLGMTPEAAAAGVLEISAWNQANALRQVTVKRGLDVRDFTLVTFGGSGSLLLCRLMDVLGIPTVLVPPDPGNVSAFGLLTVDVKNDYVQTHVTLADRLDPAEVGGDVRRADRSRRGPRCCREGFAEEQHGFARTADLRYFGQAFEVRVRGAGGAVRRRRSPPRSPTRSTPSTAPSTATTSPTTPTSRSSGSTCGCPASARSSGPRSGVRRSRWLEARWRSLLDLRPRASRTYPTGLLRPRRRVRRHAGRCWRTDLAPGTTVAGPAIIEEYGSTVPIHPGLHGRGWTTTATWS